MKYSVWVAVAMILGGWHFAHAAVVVDIVFPVEGGATYTDDFYDIRSGGRYHYANDLMAPKMTPVLAATDGVITFAPMTQPSYGYMLTLQGDDGFTYNYVHLNNDTPGTDDGVAGPELAYVPGIEQGERVERGEHIAWVGDSGNAESVGSHLHFEIYDGDTPIDPYESLQAAEEHIDDLTFDPAAESAQATSISIDKQLEDDNDESLCKTDSLIRTEEVSTVYYCGSDGGRYVFQNESTFFSWYDSFDEVEYVTPDVMAAIPLSGNVTYKPGSFMIKILSSPKVYAVGQNGTLHWVASASMAETLYGANWPTFVRDIPDGFWAAYEVGDDVTTP